MITGARLTLWLIVNAAICATFSSSSGQELLAISAETFSGDLKVWIGQSLLTATGFRFFCDRHAFQIGGRRMGAAALAVIPLLLTAFEYWLAAAHYELSTLKSIPSAHFYFYCTYALTVFVCLTTIRVIPDTHRVKMSLSLAGFVIVILLSFLPHLYGALFGTSLVISIAACVLFNVSMLLSRMTSRVRLRSSRLVKGVLVSAGPIISIWMLFALSQNNHFVRNIDHDESTIEDYSHWRVTLDDSIGQWYAQKKKQNGVAVMLLVESAGGGLRASYWTSVTLASLDQIDGFRDHLFAISSVSGASLGATLFRADIASGADRSLEFERLKAFYAHDFLGPLTAGLLFSDVSSSLFPVGVLPDRAEALERSWESAWRDVWHSDAFGEDFRNLWPALPAGFKNGDPMPQGRWPHLILNGASLENGVALVTSDVSSFAFGNEQFPRVVEMLPLRFPTSTAINNSARFPVIEPPGLIVVGKNTVTQFVRSLGIDKDADTDAVQDLVVDGGYVDNYGSFALSEVLDHVKWFNCRLARSKQRTSSAMPLDSTGCDGFIRSQPEPGIVPIVIQITSDPDSIRTSADSCACLDTPAVWRLPRPGFRTKRDISNFTELLAPVTALDQMRQRSGVTFTADLPKRPDVLSYFHFGIGPPYPRDGTIHRDEPVPSLNWALSAESMRQLEQYVSQCDNLQAREIGVLINNPDDAAESTRRRRLRAQLSSLKSSVEGDGKLCR